MTEQETVDLLVGRLEASEAFVHVRFGDGDVFFATGTGPTLTADGEEWSPELRDQLRAAWRALAPTAGLLLGDVESYLVSDGCEAQWRELLAEATEIRGEPPELVHIEALRAGLGYALPFYQAVAADDRRKVFVGPERLASVATMLRSDFVPVPLHVAHTAAPRLVDEVAAGMYEVALFAAGRGGKIMQAALALRDPFLTQVDVGSGLDLLFGGVRRGTDRTADPEQLRKTYRDAGLDVR